jgi:hypothetical protein
MIGQTISHYHILEKPPTTSRKNGTSAKELADKLSGRVGEGEPARPDSIGARRPVRRSTKYTGGSSNFHRDNRL